MWVGFNMNEQQAYDLGVDCAKNGVNTTNCHFSIFDSSSLTKAWERGRDSITKKPRGVAR